MLAHIWQKQGIFFFSNVACIHVRSTCKLSSSTMKHTCAVWQAYLFKWISFLFLFSVTRVLMRTLYAHLVAVQWSIHVQCGRHICSQESVFIFGVTCVLMLGLYVHLVAVQWSIHVHCGRHICAQELFFVFLSNMYTNVMSICTLSSNAVKHTCALWQAYLFRRIYTHVRSICTLSSSAVKHKCAVWQAYLFRRICTNVRSICTLNSSAV